jgi:hypothetical protein
MNDNYDLSSMIGRLPQNLPQCYHTANLLYDQLLAGDRFVREQHFDNLNHLREMLPMAHQTLTSVVEINIALHENWEPKETAAELRDRFQVHNTFWVPRIFNHSFNIFMYPDSRGDHHVLVGQSWFRVSNYDIITTFPNKQALLDWISKLESRLRKYKQEPAALFDLFRFFEFPGQTRDSSANLFRLITEIDAELHVDLSIKAAVSERVAAGSVYRERESSRTSTADRHRAHSHSEHRPRTERRRSKRCRSESEQLPEANAWSKRPRGRRWTRK